jgi:ribosomal protein L30/L7E
MVIHITPCVYIFARIFFSMLFSHFILLSYFLNIKQKIKKTIYVLGLKKMQHGKFLFPSNVNASYIYIINSLFYRLCEISMMKRCSNLGPEIMIIIHLFSVRAHATCISILLRSLSKFSKCGICFYNYGTVC